MQTLRVNVDGGNVRHRFFMQLFIACISELPDDWDFLSKYTLDLLCRQLAELGQAIAAINKREHDRVKRQTLTMGVYWKRPLMYGSLKLRRQPP